MKYWRSFAPTLLLLLAVFENTVTVSVNVAMNLGATNL